MQVLENLKIKEKVYTEKLKKRFFMIPMKN